MIYQICITLQRSQKQKILMAIDVIAMLGAFYFALTLSYGGGG